MNGIYWVIRSLQTADDDKFVPGSGWGRSHTSEAHDLESYGFRRLVCAGSLLNSQLKFSFSRTPEIATEGYGCEHPKMGNSSYRGRINPAKPQGTTWILLDTLGPVNSFVTVKVPDAVYAVIKGFDFIRSHYAANVSTQPKYLSQERSATVFEEMKSPPPLLPKVMNDSEVPVLFALLFLQNPYFFELKAYRKDWLYPT